MIPPLNVLLPRAYWAIANKTPADGRYASEGHTTNLQPNEVFVFGSNESGFHGAGSAGFAFTGLPGNQYRAGNILLRQPKGTKGFWAILGQARGYQEGKVGRSYAICTIRQPGAKRSISLDNIKAQVLELYHFAETRPELTFFVTKSGDAKAPSLNGYSLVENSRCYVD